MGKRGIASGLTGIVAGLAFILMLTRPVLSADLAASPAHRYEMAPNASGFFIDMEGTVLTARHAVEGCGALYILKDGRVAHADLLAASDEADLALVRSSTKPYLAATFASVAEVQGSRPVFAAGYDVLQHMKDRNRMMYNGFTLDQRVEPGEMRFMLFSDADHGASGSPVLNGDGLVIGLVTRREAAGGLSGQGVVVAVSGAAIKEFLRRAGIAFHDGNQAEISPLQARAPRAATLTVGIICG